MGEEESNLEFRVKDILKLSPLKNAIVLSGEQYLHKVVKGSTIMEAPDITDWLKGGELILTSLKLGLVILIHIQKFLNGTRSKIIIQRLIVALVQVQNQTLQKKILL